MKEDISRCHEVFVYKKIKVIRLCGKKFFSSKDTEKCENLKSNGYVMYAQ